MGWDGAERGDMGRGKAGLPPCCHSAASGERRGAGGSPRAREGPRGRRCPGAPVGAEAAGSAGEGAGLRGVSSVPAAGLGAAGPRGCAGARRSGTGGQELPRPLPGAGGGAERPPGSAEWGSGGRLGVKPGWKRPCPPSQHRPGPGLRSGCSPGQRWRISPFPSRRSPRGRARSLPPAAGPEPPAAPSPLRAGRELIPGLSLGPAAASAVLWPPPEPLGPRSPPPPAWMQGRRLGSGDGLMLMRRGDSLLSACFSAPRHKSTC
ncbi:collagen alpha-1(I) chain-like [Onychostruthus taczanowskii]|uniref:collagen alpha-1(I) chain-like n=1 Tax=Onychostruthus taczanowskii TaxID=356909 RepID=UPI001B7FFE0A|nr:collagen alpha-1(I) chain-like [Onychostruthus taczanowskii]